MVRPVTITAVLKHWRVSEANRTVTGTIQESHDPEFPNGENWSIVNYQSWVHYPEVKMGKHHAEEFYYVVTHTGKYFKLYKKDQRQ